MTLELDKKQIQVNTFSPEKIELLKNTICKGSSNDEFELFMYICKHTGLDPFLKQIYSIPRGGQRTVQTSIDGFRLIAERTGKYSPGRESVFVYDDKGVLVSATAFVKKMTSDGTWHEIASTCFMSEYDGKNNFWKKFPHVMLAKCAESAALRRAFPSELSGLYTDEEMEQADIKVEGKKIQAENIQIPEIDKSTMDKEIMILLGLDEITKEVAKNYLSVSKVYFIKTHKENWILEWNKILDLYENKPSDFEKHYSNWHEKQMIKQKEGQ